MDRTRTVQDVQAGMARAEAAAQGIARSARQLPQWGSQGGAHAINTEIVCLSYAFSNCHTLVIRAYDNKRFGYIW